MKPVVFPYRKNSSFQSGRGITDEWEETIQEVIDSYGSCGIILPDIIWKALGIDEPLKARGCGSKVSKVMAKLGFKRSGNFRSGDKKRYKVWMAKSLIEEDIDAMWNTAYPELEKNV